MRLFLFSLFRVHISKIGSEQDGERKRERKRTKRKVVQVTLQNRLLLHARPNIWQFWSHKILGSTFSSCIKNRWLLYFETLILRNALSDAATHRHLPKDLFSPPPPYSSRGFSVVVSRFQLYYGSLFSGHEDLLVRINSCIFRGKIFALKIMNAFARRRRSVFFREFDARQIFPCFFLFCFRCISLIYIVPLG